MQTISITTAQNIDIDYEVAGLGERIVARVIDYSMYVAIILLYLLLIDHMPKNEVLWGFTFPQIIFFVFYGFYDLVTEMFFNGQSLGKYIMKIRVISLDGGRPRVGQYMLRYIFRIVDFLLTAGVGAIISVAITENKQRIGDIVAGTTLVKTKPRTDFEGLYKPEVEEGYEPVFTVVTNLTDRDVALITEVVNHFYKTGDTVMVDNMANKIKTYLDIEAPEGLNNAKFLRLILKDYNHITINMSSQIA